MDTLITTANLGIADLVLGGLPEVLLDIFQGLFGGLTDGFSSTLNGLVSSEFSSTLNGLSAEALSSAMSDALSSAFSSEGALSSED